MNVFSQFLSQVSAIPLAVIDAAIPLNFYVSIDISENNSAVLDFNIADSGAWEKYINSYLSLQNSQVAHGGYLEKRNLYDRSAYFKNVAEHNKRNIHLGIDLWCAANTKVLAVLTGEVHSYKNNKNHGDYGPTIILKHSIAEKTFYSLYGHLSEASIATIKVGDLFVQGSVLGFLGEASVNGDYAPHLHFQIIKDLADYFGDYPGVSASSDLEFYQQNCPDPNVLLKIR
ncbi:putative enzyme with aminotransferase class-III domain protein [Polaribacter irgensii 23-P]|uniref:Putative enzyme with aminotransferase class-III domain protein n=1 Tax=Polaribacter irgensii 23-P TaxID=313594 RepID=A4C0C8_9FLAO|nr:peptidoglycan DD-metalloendopeptidase family protein [Polaribacter irgensii]EAR12871.1 putative enzyme with aminotransferase class-III domain protein [Polaribacter irgensii 23-P]